MEAPADIKWNGYSLAERDWRWQRVRDNAAQAGLDCVFVPLCVDGRNLHLSLEQARGTRSDCRFLTCLDNAAVILPTDGRTPIVISDEASSNDWIPEFRAVEGSWGATMAQALIDARMERARIGVSGIRRGFYTHGRAFHGVVNHASYVEVLKRLPNATFENATEVIGHARYVKSAEQIACLRRGAAIAAAGIDKMIELARPGMDEGLLYTRVMQRMVGLGSEYYPMAFYSGLHGGRLPRFEDPTEGRTLQANYRIANEVDAVFGGLIAQEQQPIFLGSIPDAWKPAIELQRDMYYTALEHLTPGRPFAEIMDLVNGFGAKRGMKSQLLMHGRGYGDDGPLFTPQNRGARNRELRVEKNCVFIVKPIAHSADGSFDMSWGGCVLVTDKGGEALIKRTPEMVSIA